MFGLGLVGVWFGIGRCLVYIMGPEFVVMAVT